MIPGRPPVTRLRAEQPVVGAVCDLEAVVVTAVPPERHHGEAAASLDGLFLLEPAVRPVAVDDEVADLEAPAAVESQRRPRVRIGGLVLHAQHGLAAPRIDPAHEVEIGERRRLSSLQRQHVFPGGGRIQHVDGRGKVDDDPPSRAHLRRGGIERRLNRGHDAHSPETRRLPGAQTRDREGLEPVSHVDDVGRTAGADGAARIRQRRGVLERRPPGGNGRVVVERRDLDLRMAGGRIPVGVPAGVARIAARVRLSSVAARPEKGLRRSVVRNEAERDGAGFRRELQDWDLTGAHAGTATTSGNSGEPHAGGWPDGWPLRWGRRQTIGRIRHRDHIPRARALGLLTRAGKSGRASWQLTPKAKAFQDWEGTTGLTPAHVEGDLDRWRDRWDARRAPY